MATKLRGVITKSFKAPTKTERSLQQSLPESQRKLPVQEVVRQQTVSRGQTRAPTQTLVSQRIRSAAQRAQAQQQATVRKLKQTAAQLRAKDTAKRQALKIRATQERLQKRIITRQQRILKQSFVSAEDLFRAGRKKVTRPFKPIPKFKRFNNIKTKGLTAVDIISGGRITQSQLNKKQEKLNKDIGSFNKDFGNVSLTESQFNRAATLQSDLEQRSQGLDIEQQKLFGSKRFKFAESITLIKRKPLTQKQIEKRIEFTTKELKATQDEIRDATKSKSKFKNINLKRLRKLEQGRKKAVRDSREGKGAVIIAGTFPIIPLTQIPSGVTTVLFSGKQKVRGGRIITDIIFKTSRGQVGLAKGVTVTEGAKGFSVVAGRTGRVAVKFPSRKPKVIGIRSFVGKETTQTKPAIFKVQDTIELLKKKRKIGRIKIIKRNIEGLIQKGVGEVGVFRGRRIVRSRLLRRRKKKVQLDELASLASIFTRKELSLIIGKTITRFKVKSNFIGLIKGDKNIESFKFIAGEKQQLQKALSNVISSSASAIARAEKSGAVVKDIKIATASTLIKAPTIVKPELVKAAVLKTPTKTFVKEVKQEIKTIDKKIGEVKGSSSTTQGLLNKSNQKSKQLTTQISQTRNKQKLNLLQKQKNKQKQKQNLLQKQLQKQKQKQKLLLKQKQVQVQRIRPASLSIKVSGRGIKLPRIKLPKKKITIKKKSKKSQAVFNVFGKARGKFVKLNKEPLRRGDALSKGAFAIDQTTARTFKIESAGKSKKPGKLLKGERNYFKRQGFKLREVKIRKGRKFKLKNKFIEKTKHAIDTKSEKSGLSIARLLKEQRGPTPAKARMILRDKKIRGRPLTVKQRRFFQARANIKSRTPAQRKTMLKNLAKARRVRKKNLKGGKK